MRNRKNGSYVHHGVESGRGNLAGNLGNPDWSPQLIGRLPAYKDPADVGERPGDHKPRFLRAHNDGPQRSGLLRLDVAGRHRPADTKHANAMDIAKIVLELLELWCGLERDRRAA